MALFENLSHIYVTWRYNAKASSPWAGETVQNGLRIIVDSDVKPLSAGRVDPTLNWGAENAALTRTITNFEVQQGWSGVTIGSYAVTDADKDQIAAAVATWLDIARTTMSNEYELESIRLYPICSSTTVGGVYGNSATAPDIYYPTVTAFDGLGTSLIAPEVATVASFYTAVRGPSGRGRIYLGALNENVTDVSGLVEGPIRTNIVNGCVGLVQNIRVIDTGVGALRYTPAVWSKGATLTGGADTFSVINKVRCNDEMDTQRRRQRQRTPVWTDASVT